MSRQEFVLEFIKRLCSDLSGLALSTTSSFHLPLVVWYGLALTIAWLFVVKVLVTVENLLSVVRSLLMTLRVTILGVGRSLVLLRELLPS